MSVKVRERPKGSGVYWIFIDHNGKRKAKKVGDKKTANTLAKKLEAKIAMKQFNLDEEKIVPTFKEYSDTWLEEYIGALREPATKERYETILKHVNPILGSKPINEITRGDVRKLLLQLNKKGGSRSHICLVRDVLSGALHEDLWVPRAPRSRAPGRFGYPRSPPRPPHLRRYGRW